MNRNENLMEEFIEKLTQTAMNSSITELLLPKKIKGNLINVLNSCDEEQLLIIANSYFNKKKIDELVGYNRGFLYRETIYKVK